MSRSPGTSSPLGSFSPLGHPADAYIAGQIARTNRNLLVWNAILLAAVLCIAGLMHTYLDCFFRGPFPANDATLLAAAERTQGSGLISWVELRNRKLLPTGWTEVSTSNDVPYERLPYYLMPVGHSGDMILVQTHASGAHIVATLYSVPRDIQNGVIAPIVKKHPELRGKILPVMLNGAAAFRVAGYILLPILALFALLGVFNVARAILRGGDPSRHPIVRRLAKYDLAARVDSAVASSSAQRFGKALLADSLLLRPTPFGMQILDLRETVWSYPLKFNGSPVAVFCQSDGKTHALALKAQEVSQLLKRAAQQVPWAFFGFDAARHKEWRKNKTAIIAEVQSRRDAYMARIRQNMPK